MDKAGKTYWNNVWGKVPLEDVADYKFSLNNHVNRKFHQYFTQIFQPFNTRGKNLLEIGCARSRWLPYFAKEFGFKISGIDYSEIGCQQAMQILSNEGIEGEIICADFFSPPETMLGKFDAVVSFGVVEHFEDTAACLRSFSKLLKPGGSMINSIPNMIGINGFLQKKMNRPIYDKHSLISKEDFKNAHLKAGLKVIRNDYFIVANFSAVNIDHWPRGYRYKMMVRLRSWASKLICALEDCFSFLRPNWLTSPYINCVSQKPR